MSIDRRGIMASMVTRAGVYRPDESGVLQLVSTHELIEDPFPPPAGSPVHALFAPPIERQPGDQVWYFADGRLMPFWVPTATGLSAPSLQPGFVPYDPLA